MIKFRIRYRSFESDYPVKTYYAVNLHSVDVADDGTEKGGGYLGLLRMTEDEFETFRGVLAHGSKEASVPAEFREVT